MAKLPSVSSRKVVKAFQSFGWEVARRESSHVINGQGRRDGHAVRAGP